MPANTQKRVDIENTYYHIYNKGRENKTLFSDQEDFNTFIGYLNEYLTPPTATPTKKVFTVAGKTFQGVPHLPKNYHKKLELVAYSLIPSSFNLIVKQLEKGSLESFIRSLSTRYSIYFNKKYQRTGQLFDGPCKSKHLKNDTEVSLLTLYLHKSGGQTSINKYLDSDLPDWLTNRPDITNYAELVKKYEPNLHEQQIIKSLIFVQSHLIPKSTTIHSVHNRPVSNVGQKQTRHIKIHQRTPELAFASTMFLVLLVFGLVNINTSAMSNSPTPSPQVAGANIEEIIVKTTSTPTPVVETIDKEIIEVVVVKQTDPLVPVSIYIDMNKTIEVLKAVNGVTLDLVNKYNEWSEVKLSDGKYGFIESKYIKSL